MEFDTEPEENFVHWHAGGKSTGSVDPVNSWLFSTSPVARITPSDVVTVNTNGQRDVVLTVSNGKETVSINAKNGDQINLLTLFDDSKNRL